MEGDLGVAVTERFEERSEVPPRSVTQDEPTGGPAADWLPSMTPGQLAPVNPARYQFIREYARGGLGRILEVRDLRLGRVVAVKEILADSRTAHARFVREAMITARLEHPGIVPVHDIGRWPSGEPFYAMKLVSGRSLHELIYTTPALTDRLALLPSVIAVADAIAYAHSRHVIHRDLKPANIVVGEFGETVVIDWGLAKDLRAGDDAADASGGGAVSEDRTLTAAGAVVGTVSYMPPEQARGAAVDERVDVYALGALLYELLVGEPPYAGAAAPLAAVQAGPPPPPEALQRAVPPELATIVRKAMARQPGERYPSARELAEDLRRFQTGRLVTAHVYSRPTLIKRWLRRYRALVSVVAAALAVLAVGGAIMVQRVVTQRDVARRRADQLVLAQARGLVERDATRALGWLRSYPADGEDQAGRRALAIAAVSHGVARHLLPRDGFFAFTADGRGWIGAPDGEHIDVHDATTGARIAQWPHHGRVGSIVAVPGGTRVAVLDVSDTVVTLLDLATGQTRKLADHTSPIAELAASPDGRWIAAAGADGVIHLAPTGGGEPRVLGRHEGEVTSLTFTRDGRWLFAMARERAAARLWALDERSESAGVGSPRVLSEVRDIVGGDVSVDGGLAALAHRDGAVSLWDLATGAMVRSLGRHAGAANAVAFSPDGRWIASIGDDGNLRVTSIATGSERARGGHGALTGLAFSSDSAWIATGSADGEVRLWQVDEPGSAGRGSAPESERGVIDEPGSAGRGSAPESERGVIDGSDERILGQHPGRVFRLGFSADGRSLASQTTTAAERVNARIWDVATRGQRGLRCHLGAVFTLALSFDGRWMATGSEDHSVCLWDPRTGDRVRLDGHDGTVYSVAMSPDGARLASASFDGTVGLWQLSGCGSLAGCEPVQQRLIGHRGPVWMVAFSPDGRWIASAGSDATVRLWDAATGASRVLTGHLGAVGAVAFSPDGRLLASGGEDREVRLWDVATGRAAVLRGHTARVNRIAFSRDGRWLWTTSWDQTLRRWDVATGESRAVALQLGTVPVFAMSPDQRWLAAGDATGRVLLVDPDSLAVRVLGDQGAVVRRLAFSPDGTALASSGHDHQLRLWNLARAGLDAELQTDSEIYNIAFAPDGQWLAAVGSGPVVHRWPVPAPGAVPTEPAQLSAWLATLSTAALDVRESPP